MLSRRLVEKQSGRRPLTALAIAGLLGSLLLAGGTALAVHDDAFQLDGETTLTDQTPGTSGHPNRGLGRACSTRMGRTTTAIDPTNIDPGFTARRLRPGLQSQDWQEQFLYDPSVSSQGLIFCTNDTTTFATGSKDILAITRGGSATRTTT